jgi:SAM-dependent methyltransferase
MSADQTRLDPAVMREQQLWRTPESQAFYQSHRNSAADLYRSELFFLPDVASRVDSMLDVGCAAGGFSRIVRTFNPALRYTGVDIAPEFVERAKREHPEANFAISDGITFPFPPGSFELVHCSGVLHLNTRYREMVQAMWAMTSRFLLCDLRLTDGPGEVGRLIRPFGETAATTSALNYTVVNLDAAVKLFRELEPAPAAIAVKGYPHRANAAELVAADVIMAFFLVEKQGGATATRVEVDINA